jgi:4-carboxymuconolactone decarboxylase
MQRPNKGRGAILAQVAPTFNRYTEEVLMQDLWDRPGLSQRDRSLCVIAALIALHRPDQMNAHMRTGLDNGLTRKEIAEVITHLAFYTSFPNAAVAARKFTELVATLDEAGSGATVGG